MPILNAMEVPVETKSELGRPKIKAVVFDWGGVITVPPGPVIDELYRNVEVDQKELLARRAKYRDDDPNSQFAKLERGELSLNSYLAWSRSDLPGAQAIWDPQSPHFLFAHLAVVPQVVEGISRLRERGFVTGLLTNNIVEAWPTVTDGLEVEELFDIVINSAFVGMRKPEERIYAYLLEELQMMPENVLFLDDNRVNIEAARAFGLQTIEVKQPDEVWPEVEQVLREDQGT